MNKMKWKEEFDEFMKSSESIRPAPEHSQQLLEKVRNELSPQFSTVLSKLILLQFISGTATLSICPQFGIGPIGGGNGVLHWVEHYGSAVCGSFCGSFFLIFSAIFAGLIFSRPERRKISENTLLAFSLLSLVSFVLLSLVSLMVAEHQHHGLDLTFLTMWFISGIVLASIAFKSSSMLKGKMSS
jgi:hypothetical protein